tara:strand:+ start:125898 stop:126578 length:681 start_codon:yes stop_codon:yes gene_type:complete
MSAKAAGPIMHAYLGLKWLAVFAPDYDENAKREFILGTLFPDIRYIGNIPRSKTHLKNISLVNIAKEQSPFIQGMQFHSYVDNMRFYFLKHHAIQKNIDKLPNKHKSIFIKLIEDQILFEQQNSWHTIKKYLVDPCDGEKNFDLDIATLTKWHLGLTYYFSALPSTILSQISMFNKGILMLDAPTVNAWSISIKEYASDEAFNQYISDLVKYFDEKLSSEKPSLAR